MYLCLSDEAIDNLTKNSYSNFLKILKRIYNTNGYYPKTLMKIMTKVQKNNNKKKSLIYLLQESFNNYHLEENKEIKKIKEKRENNLSFRRKKKFIKYLKKLGFKIKVYDNFVEIVDWKIPKDKEFHFKLIIDLLSYLFISSVTAYHKGELRTGIINKSKITINQNNFPRLCDIYISFYEKRESFCYYRRIYDSQGISNYTQIDNREKIEFNF